MKVYISCTLGKDEQHIISILALKLEKDGFTIAGISEPVTEVKNKDLLDYASQTAIASADLLIGLVSGKNKMLNFLYSEWSYAQEKNIPFLLLVEKGVSIQNKFHANTVFFDRKNIDEAIKSIEEKKRFYKLANYGRVKSFIWDAGADILLAILPVLADTNSRSVA